MVNERLIIMFNVQCKQCKNNIQEEENVFIFNDRIFCSKDCLYDYLIINMFVDHVRLISVEDK